MPSASSPQKSVEVVELRKSPYHSHVASYRGVPSSSGELAQILAPQLFLFPLLAYTTKINIHRKA